MLFLYNFQIVQINKPKKNLFFVFVNVDVEGDATFPPVGDDLYVSKYFSCRPPHLIFFWPTPSGTFKFFSDPAHSKVFWPSRPVRIVFLDRPTEFVLYPPLWKFGALLHNFFLCSCEISNVSLGILPAAGEKFCFLVILESVQNYLSIFCPLQTKIFNLPPKAKKNYLQKQIFHWKI